LGWITPCWCRRWLDWKSGHCREVCLNIAALDFVSDPADELIAATSLTYRVPLVTRDERIRACKKLTLA